MSHNTYKKFDLAEIANLSKDKYDPQKNTLNLPCVELEHLSQGSGVIIGSVNSRDQKSTKNKFNVGDVLFGKLRPYLRKYAYPNFQGVCSSEIWVLKANQKICTSKYLFYLIQSSKFIEMTNKTTGTKMPRADWDLVSTFSFSTPALREHQKIALILSSVDDLIDKTKSVIEQNKKLKQALLKSLLSKGVPGWHDNEPHTWMLRGLDELIELAYGKSQSGLQDGNNPIYGTNGVCAYTSEYLFDGPSIIIGRKGTIDKPLYVDGKFWVLDTAYYIKKHREIDLKFLLYYLYNLDLKQFNEASGVPSLIRETFYQIKLRLPTLPEQEKIGSILSDLDLTIEKNQESLNQLLLAKQSLMQVLLTGKLRVEGNLDVK